MARSAAKIVTDAILGRDLRVVSVGGRAYTIEPPTIYRLAGAANCLTEVADAKSIADILTRQPQITALTCALSWFIGGDDKLSSELQKGTLEEVVGALKAAYDLISVKDFLTLSILVRNVVETAANQKQ